MSPFVDHGDCMAEMASSHNDVKTLHENYERKVKHGKKAKKKSTIDALLGVFRQVHVFGQGLHISIRDTRSRHMLVLIGARHKVQTGHRNMNVWAR